MKVGPNGGERIFLSTLEACQNKQADSLLRSSFPPQKKIRVFTFVRFCFLWLASMLEPWNEPHGPSAKFLWSRCQNTIQKGITWIWSGFRDLWEFLVNGPLKRVADANTMCMIFRQMKLSNVKKMIFWNSISSLVVLISDDGEDDRGRNIHDGTLNFIFPGLYRIKKEAISWFYSVLFACVCLAVNRIPPVKGFKGSIGVRCVGFGRLRDKD